MKNILLIAAAIVLIATPVLAADNTNNTVTNSNRYGSARERELDKEIELIKLQEAIRQQKAYEERMKEHAEKLDCIVCK